MNPRIVTVRVSRVPFVRYLRHVENILLALFSKLYIQIELVYIVDTPDESNMKHNNVEIEYGNNTRTHARTHTQLLNYIRLSILNYSWSNNGK